MAPRAIQGLANLSVSGKGAKARAVTASTATRLSGSIASTRTGRIAAAPPVARDAANTREWDGEHEPGQAGAGAHVDPAFGLWRERNELGRIRDMAGPDG